MRAAKNNVSIFLASVIFAEFATSSVQASEKMHQCTDMPLNHELIELGRSEIKKLPNPRTFVIPAGDSIIKRGFDYDVIYGNASDVPMAPPQTEIETLPVSTKADIQAALKLAATYEDFGLLKYALRIYLRILEPVKQLYGGGSSNYAETLEDIANLEILMGTSKFDFADSEKPDFLSNIRIVPKKQIASESLMSVALNTVLASESKVNSSAQTRLDSAITGAERRYDTAFEIRTRPPFNDPNLFYSLLMRAAFAERRGDIDAARQLRIRALDIQLNTTDIYTSNRGHAIGFPSPYSDFVSHVRRFKDWDLARKRMQDLVKLAKEDSGRQIVSLLDTLAESDSTDAQHLLLLCINQNAPFSIPPRVVSPFIGKMPQTEKALLANYLVSRVESYKAKKYYGFYYRNNLPRDVRSVYDKLYQENRTELSDILHAVELMEQRGWSAEALSVYNALAMSRESMHDLPDLVRCAVYFEKCQEPVRLAKAIQDFSAIVSSKAPLSEADCQEKLTLLSPLMTVISGSALSKLPECKSSVDRVRQLKHYYEELRQKMQCLDAARTLNTTASELEIRKSYALAERLYNQALIIQLKNLSSDDASIAVQYGELAHVAALQHKNSLADSYFRKAIAIFSAQPSRGAWDSAYMTERYGQFLIETGNRAAGNETLERARSMFKRLPTKASLKSNQ